MSGGNAANANLNDLMKLSFNDLTGSGVHHTQNQPQMPIQYQMAPVGYQPPPMQYSPYQWTQAPYAPPQYSPQYAHPPPMQPQHQQPSGPDQYQPPSGAVGNNKPQSTKKHSALQAQLAANQEQLRRRKKHVFLKKGGGRSPAPAPGPAPTAAVPAPVTQSRSEPRTPPPIARHPARSRGPIHNNARQTQTRGKEVTHPPADNMEARPTQPAAHVGSTPAPAPADREASARQLQDHIVEARGALAEVSQIKTELDTLSTRCVLAEKKLAKSITAIMRQHVTEVRLYDAQHKLMAAKLKEAEETAARERNAKMRVEGLLMRAEKGWAAPEPDTDDTDALFAATSVGVESLIGPGTKKQENGDAAARAENERLRAENEQLRAMLEAQLDEDEAQLNAEAEQSDGTDDDDDQEGSDDEMYDFHGRVDPEAEEEAEGEAEHNDETYDDDDEMMGADPEPTPQPALDLWGDVPATHPTPAEGGHKRHGHGASRWERPLGEGSASPSPSKTPPPAQTRLLSPGSSGTASEADDDPMRVEHMALPAEEAGLDV